MSNGLKNIQSHARAYSRRERLESGQPMSQYEDDSGVSGIGLTPIDDMEEHDYSSPEATSSTGSHSTPGGSSGHGSSGSHHGYGGHHLHSHHNSYQSSNYGGYQPHHTYSHSVSSTGTAGYGGQHHQQGNGQSSQGTSPYMGHGNRLPSVGDMGIDAIMNRNGSNGV